MCCGFFLVEPIRKVRAARHPIARLAGRPAGLFERFTAAPSAAGASTRDFVPTLPSVLPAGGQAAPSSPRASQAARRTLGQVQLRNPG